MKKRRKNTSWWGPARRSLPALETLAVPKNTTGVMFERPGASWRHPKATKNTTGVMFEPSQGVLEASRRVPQRPRAYRMPPGVSQSVLEHPESLQECLPGVSWTLEGHKTTLVSSIQCLLEGSDNFVVGLILFQGVLERFGSLRKRPRASQKSPGMSQSTLQRAPGTLQNVPKRPRVSDWAFANGLQDIRDVSGKALHRTRMPGCLHMARQSRAPHSSMLPQVPVKITSITSIANGVILAILSLVILSATTIQTISMARGASAPSC